MYTGVCNSCLYGVKLTLLARLRCESGTGGCVSSVISFSLLSRWQNFVRVSAGGGSTNNGVDVEVSGVFRQYYPIGYGNFCGACGGRFLLVFLISLATRDITISGVVVRSSHFWTFASNVGSICYLTLSGTPYSFALVFHRFMRGFWVSGGSNLACSRCQNWSGSCIGGVVDASWLLCQLLLMPKALQLIFSLRKFSFHWFSGGFCPAEDGLLFESLTFEGISFFRVGCFVFDGSVVRQIAV